MSDAYDVPLLEVLDSVPLNGRAVWMVSTIESRNIPYGNICQQAAMRIRQLECELADVKALLQKACAELPVSYYPDNTPEKLASNIAGFVNDYTENYSGMENAIAALTAITSGHFYQSYCRGGEMERLMNKAIEALGGKQ